MIYAMLLLLAVLAASAGSVAHYRRQTSVLRLDADTARRTGQISYGELQPIHVAAMSNYTDFQAGLDAATAHDLQSYLDQAADQFRSASTKCQVIDGIRLADVSTHRALTQLARQGWNLDYAVSESHRQLGIVAQRVAEIKARMEQAPFELVHLEALVANYLEILDHQPTEAETAVVRAKLLGQQGWLAAARKQLEAGNPGQTLSGLESIDRACQDIQPSLPSLPAAPQLRVIGSRKSPADN